MQKNKKKRRASKQRNHKIEYQIIIDIILRLIESQSLPVFTETATEIERNKIVCKSQNLADLFSKQIYSKW